MMRKFRITGIDRDSGFETSVIIEAAHQDAAEQEAVRRGIAVRHVEEVSPHLEAIGFERLQDAIRAQERASIPSIVLTPQQSRPSAPAFIMPPRDYWRAFERSVAKGVFFGLMTWLVFWIVAPFIVILVILILARAS